MYLNTVPSGPPQDLEGTALSANGIEIAWTAPKPEDQNGILKNYFITVTEAETGTIIEFENDPIELFLIVNSLHPYYTYQCSVVAATVVGAGPAMEVTVVTHEQGTITSILVLIRIKGMLHIVISFGLVSII